MSVPNKAREAAVRMLFQWEMSKETPERVKTLYWESARSPASVRDATNAFFDGVMERIEAIDPLIRTHTEHWRIERMSAVDRNILRLAIYEFLARDISHRIVINEAIELARRYSGDESALFINGVLDAVYKAVTSDK